MRLIVEGRGANLSAPLVGRARRHVDGVCPESTDDILVTDRSASELPGGFAGYVMSGPVEGTGAPSIGRVESVEDIGEGHLVAMVPHPSGRAFVRTLYRPESPHNFLFITDRCNSFCLMCSQPPKDRDDAAFHGHLNREVVRLMREPPGVVGITGGEPTLAGEELLSVFRALLEKYPETRIHMLSNGRGFAWRSQCRAYAEACGPNLTVAVPLYSDDAGQHDHVVQAKGAFDQTVRGLMNLARWGIDVEIRVVIHALTLPRLPEIANFIGRTFPFASHVALMGLEPTGFAKANFDQLWVDPGDEAYQRQLSRATRELALRGMTVSIYNHQLCVVPKPLWAFASRSISDWKSEYLPVCRSCIVKARCGGFFASAAKARHSRFICPVSDRASDDHDASQASVTVLSSAGRPVIGE